MSSSRSLATARARRAGETAPPVSGGRPGTSIGSHAAFAPPPPQYNQMQQPSGNVRVAKQQGQYPPQGQYSPQGQYPPQGQGQQNGLPFSKLSISDAIGLITLRLGRVEQFMMDMDNDETTRNTSNIPENSRIIDNSVLTTIVNRLDSLEKREPGTSGSTEETAKLIEDIKLLTENVNKQNVLLSKHSEQLFKFERDYTETKDMLRSLSLKFDLFVSDTNTKFSDYEFAITELEKNIPVTENVAEEELEVTETNVNNEVTMVDETISTLDLKSIAKGLAI